MAAKKKSNIEKDQPVINIGLIGHVDHGKTTLTERFSGKWTDTHSEELKRGITIRLGYADAVFRKCTKCNEYTTKETCTKCNESSEPVRKISFIDAPGHESLMATMISGSAIMDGALLLIAANEDCPQPQTKEHLMSLEIVGIKNLVIIQNKIDLISEEGAKKNYEQIKEFIKGTPYEDAPIIPISAKMGINIDMLIQAIEEHIPTPKRDTTKDPMMFVARSFDINKPGALPQEMIGGILGGTIKQGKLKKGDKIEILPGRKVTEKNTTVWKPIKTEITGMMTAGNQVKELIPGGSVAVMTKLDPAMVKSDTLSGAVVGKEGKMPPVLHELEMELHLLERVVGSKETVTVEPIKMNEILMLNVNSAATVGFVTNVKKDKVSCKLKLPICAEPGSRITISRRLGNRFRLIGYGIITQQ
ncbi:MAG: translation initiation factor IF-2 subunit gamma [Candidatus Woesearchaeota archaeon]